MSGKISWIPAAVAYLGAPTWAWLAIRADHRAQMEAYKFIKCGTPTIFIMLLACVIVGVSSLVASALSLLPCRMVLGPRPKIPSSGVTALLLPLLVATVVAVLIRWA